MQGGYADVTQVFSDLAATKGRLTFVEGKKDFVLWQAELRERLVDLLRLPVMPGQPPDVEVLTSEDCGSYIREKIVMRAVDGLGVPAYLLRPTQHRGPRPAVLAIHGHGPGKCIPVNLPPPDYDVTGITEGERDYAVQAVEQGMIALAPDLRGFGELMLDDEFSREHGNSCIQLACRALQTGRTLLGMRIADLMQFVDWLQTHPDVDAKRICATGNSGGGTVTLFLSAVDRRVAVAVPGCYFCTFQDSTLSIHHCPCNYVPDLSAYAEMHDVAGLIAPRAMLVVAGQDDDIFPIDGVRRAYAALEKVYAAAGAEQNVELYVGHGGHRYFKERVWPFIGENLAEIE